MKLDELPKKNIYEAPADYFEKLPAVMMARVNSSQKDRQNIFTLFRALPELKYALAGLALLISFLFIFLANSPQTTSGSGESTQILASVSDNEAMEYLITSGQLENYDLASLPPAEQDFSHEFIQASEDEIMREVEFADLNDITNN